MKVLNQLDSLDNIKDGETRKLITKTTSSGSGNVVSSVSVSGDTITYTKGVTAITDVSDKVAKAGDTMTGALTVPQVKTGTDAANYFQCQKFRGQGDADSYYHALDYGYQSHDRWDFYEYGGIFQFHKHTGAAVDSGDTVLGTINSNGWQGNVKGDVTGNLTGLASKATGDKNGDDITTTYYKASNPAGYVTTDTKNTTGSTDTSSKIYLVGATSQAANPQTYSDNEVYATSGVLTTKSVQVGGTSVTMQFNATDDCVEFIFA